MVVWLLPLSCCCLAAPGTLPCSFQAAVTRAGGKEPLQVKRLLGKKGHDNAVNTKDVVSTSVKEGLEISH